MEVVREVWAVMASAGQVQSWLVAVEARNLTRSSVHHCTRAMSTGEGSRSRTARHELLKMVPNVDRAVALMRACFELPCTLRGSAPPRRSVDTCATGANTTDLLPDVVVSTGKVLCSGTAVGKVVSPSWSRDRTAGAADVSAVVTADIATASVVIEAAVVVAAVVAQDASVAYDPGAGCDLDHRRGAWLSVYRGGLAHGLHLQLRFSRRPHGQRPALGLRHSSSLDPTASSPPEQSHFPCLSNQIRLSLRTNQPHREIGK